MDQVIELAHTVKRVVEEYGRSPWIKATGYPVSDLSRQSFAVLVFPDYPRKWQAGIVVSARVMDDRVVIDEDTTDRPLWEALVQAGIPREQIVLAYAGESMPDQA